MMRGAHHVNDYATCFEMRRVKNDREKNCRVTFFDRVTSMSLPTCTKPNRLQSVGLLRVLEPLKRAKTARFAPKLAALLALGYILPPRTELGVQTGLTAGRSISCAH